MQQRNVILAFVHRQRHFDQPCRRGCIIGPEASRGIAQQAADNRRILCDTAHAPVDTGAQACEFQVGPPQLVGPKRRLH